MLLVQMQCCRCERKITKNHPFKQKNAAILCVLPSGRGLLSSGFCVAVVMAVK